jgi:hypothetical protein
MLKKKYRARDLKKTGVSGFARGFFRINPVPETLAGHRLRLITGVFGVIFLLLGNFSKLSIEGNRVIRVTQKKISSDRKKP